MTLLPHILVVEDDELVAEVVVDALDGRYRTSRAETAAAALACLRDGGIDAMLLDCSLPGGIDPQLLLTADTTGVPIILMSGNPEMIARLAAPNRRSILKPFSLTLLFETIEGVLQSKAGAPPPLSARSDAPG